MKQTLIALLLLATGSLFAQKSPYSAAVSDDLLNNKGATLSRYLPMADSNTFWAAAFFVGPDEFLGKLEAFKKEMLAPIDKEQDATLKELKVKDLDYYTRNLVNVYIISYGWDSLPGADGETKHLKRLSPEERAKLDKKTFEGGNPGEPVALFKRSGAYRQWLEDYLTQEFFKRQRDGKYQGDTTLRDGGMYVAKLRIVQQEVTDPFIKEYLSYNPAAFLMTTAKNETTRHEAYNTFMKVASNVEAKNELKQLLGLMTSNAMAPEFNYANVDNRKVALKNLRGKYVYIDVWATWCSPCKAEIPFLQQVEKDYHGKNIEFVSISIDADKGEWEKYVRNNKLGGIQLITDKKNFESEFIRKLYVAAVPRFILVDPKGRLVSANAPRPSDPELRVMLDKHL
ncbi:TlpA family protein disulfide reductase [Chitinophaga arvensicola]|uniref:Thiol-disulfide isomerase or thioredoxin n=1 Tax=Chitinophaga arvensicola TaxID=29529 RepID=A0A1I0NJV9_9BACT|nr:TlpA disulfide reductase family protein [Chitinophaga arvensicola]SEW01678.1 Thiol-disulfide isomerase or thioredoxin [Chitinophaga arvensicola]